MAGTTSKIFDLPEATTSSDHGGNEGGQDCSSSAGSSYVVMLHTLCVGTELAGQAARLGRGGLRFFVNERGVCCRELRFG